MSVLRAPILGLARSDRARRLAESLPAATRVVRRYVPGESTAAAVQAAAALAGDGLHATLDYLGEDTRDLARAEATVEAYLTLLEGLAERGLTRGAEVSVKLSAIGLALPGDGREIALEHARTICAAAGARGTAVTLDMEDHTATEETLEVLHELRREFPETGAVLQAYLHRTEDDCRALAYEGSRVRLCKGAYDEPEEVAYVERREIDRAFVRCLRILMAGRGTPMVATHDPRLVEVALALAARTGRPQGSYEFQMLHGVRPDEQRRLAAAGESVRVYVPYGSQWYGYLVRRLAERPRNLSLFATSLLSTK